MAKRTGPILLKPVCRPIKIRSLTRFVLAGTALCEAVTVVQVWRDEENNGPHHLSNMDLEKEAKRFHPTYCVEIAYALMELDRVAKVEVFCFLTGTGIELEWE